VSTVLHSVRGIIVAGAAVLATMWAACGGAQASEEPAALNPFGAVRQDRDDAIPGYLEMSDGQVFVGNIYMTRDKRLKMEDSMRQVGGGDVPADDNSEKRQREIPLRVVKQIEAKVEKEWVEKEWRFKELALDEKYYTGRTYPARKYVYTVTLKDGRKITAPVAEIFYVKPFRELTSGPRSEEDNEPIRFMIHKRDKGEPGTTLKDLTYVKLIKLGTDAVEEGKKKAARKGNAPAKGSKEISASSKARPAAESDPSEDDENAKPPAKATSEDEDDRPAPVKKKAGKKIKKQED
jgi:hypothetical protein